MEESWLKSAENSLQTHHVGSTLKWRGNDCFHWCVLISHEDTETSYLRLACPKCCIQQFERQSQSSWSCTAGWVSLKLYKTLPVANSKCLFWATMFIYIQYLLLSIFSTYILNDKFTLFSEASDHSRISTLSCRLHVLSSLYDKFPDLSKSVTLPIWSDGCPDQFCSRFVISLSTLIKSPMSPMDGVERTINHRFFRDVKSNKIIKNAEHFACT